MFIAVSGVAETIILISCLFVFCIIGQAFSIKLQNKLKINGRSVAGIIISSVLSLIGIIIANKAAEAIIAF